MKIHPSALKHDVAAEDAAQAAEWPLWVEPSTAMAHPIASFATASTRRRGS